MAPPAIARIDAGLKAQKKGDAPTSPKSHNKVTKSVKKPKQEFFSRFPAEIQQMIWGEALQKPACHTFKLGKVKQPPSVTNGSPKLDLQPLPINFDNSAYRFWKSLLYVRNYKVSEVSEDEEPELEEADREKLEIERANLESGDKFIAQRSQEAYSKLANQSFQAGFRRSMINLEVVHLKNKAGSWRGAAFDAATDLVILEFDRGETAPPNAWFERAEIERVRAKLKPFKRVAVHYKKSHANAKRRGPFQCWCPASSILHCNLFKACPVEQACFLDCFTELEAFYYVVDVTGKDEPAWLDEYKDFARQQGYQVKTSDDPQSAKLPLAHFYDMEKEFLQVCPRPFVEFLPQELQEIKHWLIDCVCYARSCLINVVDIYRGKRGNEQFIDSLSVRNKVKFGILLSYKLKN